MRENSVSFFSAGVFLLIGLLLMPHFAVAGDRATARAQKIQATVTAYNSPQSRVTASGMHTREGIVACPRQYPFGTRFKIDGKVYECQDRTSIKYGDRFDIWKPSRMAARTFGRRKLDIILVVGA